VPTDGLGWEWVLWVNVPIGIAAAALAPALIAAEPLERSHTRLRPRRSGERDGRAVAAGLRAC
jgi:hypothetical protein